MVFGKDTSVDIGKIGFAFIAVIDIPRGGFSTTEGNEFALWIILVIGCIAIVISSANPDIFVPALVESPESAGPETFAP